MFGNTDIINWDLDKGSKVKLLGLISSRIRSGCPWGKGNLTLAVYKFLSLYFPLRSSPHPQFYRQSGLGLFVCLFFIIIPGTFLLRCGQLLPWQTLNFLCGKTWECRRDSDALSRKELSLTGQVFCFFHHHLSEIIEALYLKSKVQDDFWGRARRWHSWLWLPWRETESHCELACWPWYVCECLCWGRFPCLWFKSV